MSGPYKRILLKISGEALAGDREFGLDPVALAAFASNIKEARNSGVEDGLVIGGGNIHRGAQAGVCSDRVVSDQMGMLATVINALAMKDALSNMGLDPYVMGAVEIAGVMDRFAAHKARKYLSSGCVVIFAAGTGSPFFTTDTTAALRALEIEADVLIKATKVNGIYDKDPVKYNDAEFFTHLSYDEVLGRNLKVMDAAAISLCRDNGLEVRVINIYDPENLRSLLRGDDIGSSVK